MSFGFLLFMLNGINVLSERAFGVLKSRSEKIKAHWLLESLSVLFIFIGFLGIYANKILDGKPHFTTWHGFLGAVTVFYSVFQLFMGLLLHFNYNLWRSLLAYSNGSLKNKVLNELIIWRNGKTCIKMKLNSTYCNHEALTNQNLRF
ncbi:unnamed protein product [Schistosoma haematobium]|nr:unnamed protein product [Schistosoma haematobium]